MDKDQATREHLQKLHEKASGLSLEFSRNIQEGAKTIEATAAELEVCPPTTSPAIRPDAEGRVTLDHRPA